jgi:hypothetical protein
MQIARAIQLTATTEQNEERARKLILQTRRVTVDEIAKRLNISIVSAYSVVHDNLQFHKVCVRWVPKELTDEPVPILWPARWKLKWEVMEHPAHSPDLTLGPLKEALGGRRL